MQSLTNCKVPEKLRKTDRNEQNIEISIRFGRNKKKLTNAAIECFPVESVILNNITYINKHNHWMKNTVSAKLKHC